MSHSFNSGKGNYPLINTGHLLFSVLVAIFAASCNDEITDLPFSAPLSGNPILLTGQIDQQNVTRANDYGFVTGDRMGIYVVDRVNGTAGTLHATDNHASNVLFTFDSDSYNWSSPTTLYWTDDQTAIDVYGYYPGANYIDNPNAWNFEVQADQSTEAQNGDLCNYEKSDLLWGCSTNVAPTAQTISIKYHHRLAGVRVHLNKGTGLSDTEWTKLERIVFAENTVLGSTVNLSTGTATLTSSVTAKPIRMLCQSGDDYRAIVIPQTVASGKTLLSITLDGQTYSHSLTSAMIYQAGKLHNFTMTINKREASGDYEIKVSDDGITPWVNDEASHNFSATAYVVVHCDKYGTLKDCITKAGYDYKTIQNLKVTGEINADDYSLMACEMPELRHLNLREAISRHVLVGHNWNTDVDYFEDDVFTGFYGNKTVRSIVIPSSTKKIHNGAFCEMNLMYSTLEIPEGVTKIGGCAFAYNEYNGVELILPATLDTIEGGACMDCQWKCELKLTDNIRYIGMDAFGTYDGAGCPNFYGVFHIPIHLTELHERMFASLGRDGSFTGGLEIPQGIVEVPAQGDLPRVFGIAFKNRISVTLPPGLKRLLSGFGGLSSLHLNDDLEEIGYKAFEAANLHFHIDFPPSLRIVGNNAFCEAALEGELVLPEQCLTLGNNAFSSNNFTKATLPSKLEEIPVELFRNNPYLREVTIPRYVDYIGECAFADCPSMQTIVCLNPEPPTLGKRVFTYGNEWEQWHRMDMDKVVLQVPEASIEAYRHAEGWSEFKNITPYRELAFNIPEIISLDKGSTLDGILRAEGAWEVSECPDWVTVSPANGTYKEELTVTVKPMSSEGEREGRIAFRLKEKDYTIYTTVHQYNTSGAKEDQTFVLQQASAGAPQEIPLFIVGEGYTAEEIVSGQYLSDMKEQMEHLFSCEPYKTYRSYFTVSTAIACSPEQGLDGRTRFGSGIDPYFWTFYTDQNRVWEYAEQHASGMGWDSHNRAVVMMLMNTHQTLNTVRLDDDGYALAMLGKSTDTYPFEQRELVLRDVGGRAFGHLASEAVNHFTFLKACTCPGCSGWTEYQRGKQHGWYENIALTSKMNEVPWSHLIFHPAYAAQVDIYEGAYNHARGTYRSENMSVMGNIPIPYFNTISRESIVRRIKRNAGETFSFEDFVEKDKMELPDE